MKEMLEQLGITQDELVGKLTEKVCEHLLGGDAYPDSLVPDFESRVAKAVQARVDHVLEAAITEHIVPRVAAMVDGIVLQETNQWGEPKKAPLTVTEYLVKRAEHFITEKVNYQGKSESEAGYSWSATTTRIAFMIHEHLQYNIDRAMKQVLGDANSVIRKGLEEAVKTALANITVKVNTEVKS